MPQAQQGFRQVQNVSFSRVEEEGSVLLYGVIGEEGWWSESGESLTDVAILQALNTLEAEGCTRINIRINSLGGYVFDGAAIVNAIQRSSAEIHTYNDGTAASMAAVIWAAAPNRHMADNASLMFHAAATVSWGNAEQLRADADMLETLDRGLQATVAAAAGGRDVADLFDGKDHWMDRAAAVAYGFAVADEAYEARVVDLATARAQRQQLTNHFQAQRAAAMANGLRPVERPARLTTDVVAPAPTTTQPSDVTAEQIQAAIANGTITADQVRAAADGETPATPASADGDSGDAPAEEAPATDATEETPAPATDPTAQLMAQVQALTAQVQALSGQPGDQPSRVAAPANAGQHGTNKKLSALDALNEAAAADHAHNLID